MTDELRIKCAKLAGWQLVDGDRDEWMRPNGTRCPGFCLPDYPNDPSAAYQLEELIPVEKRDEYSETLVDILTDGKPWTRDGLDVTWMVAHATPRQKCEAFVKTMEG